MINVMDVKSVSTSYSVVVMLSDMTKVKELEREKEMRSEENCLILLGVTNMVLLNNSFQNIKENSSKTGWLEEL